MSRQSMTDLRVRRAERGLVQMNLWIRDEDRAAFDVAVARFRQRAGELDPAMKPGRKPLEAVRASVLHLERAKSQKPPGKPQRATGRPSASKPVTITLPCRLTFPVAPSASIRNQMKAEGWHYDKLAGVWSTDDRDLAEGWLDELTLDLNARMLDPPAE
jgi:hypothetical protein